MDEYIFNRLDDDTYHCLQELYLRSFGLKETISFIRNKYDTAYTGVKNIGYIAFDQKDTPSAYYGVFPMILTAEGEDILVAQSGDTMTAPDHRGKGLFIKLAQRSYQLAWDNKVKVVFGFPNENSFPGFKKKLNWEFHGVMQRFSITNPALPLCEISSKSNTFAVFYKRFTRLILKRYRLPLNEKSIQSFSDPVSPSYIKKDIHFFQHKIMNPSSFLIGIKGFNMLIKVDPHLMIGAVSYFEAQRVPEFLSTIKRLALLLGCRKTHITVSKNHWLYQYLIPFHNSDDTLPIGFLQPDQEIRVEKITFTLADYDTF
ncbi:MAG: GNAT family N-acetyltransferase [Bacteroidales bacterium]|nr:GNAT family N-acetyltransferase [Bacteroidales bacterium]